MVLSVLISISISDAFCFLFFSFFLLFCSCGLPGMGAGKQASQLASYTHGGVPPLRDRSKRGGEKVDGDLWGFIVTILRGR